MQNITKNIKSLEAIGFARGGFAVLHKAILPGNSQNDYIVVVKFLDFSRIVAGDDGLSPEKRSQMARRWQREIRAGQTVQHPNILPILGLCDNPNPAYKEFVGIVLPFCIHGDANAYIRKHADIDRLRILVGLGAAVFALHSAHLPVVHGDIKAANILIDDNGNACLSDFGLSRIYETKGFTTEAIMGTCRWMAVELLREEQVPTTRASDIWAFAMTGLEILTKKPPFADMKKDIHVLLAVVLRQARPVRPHDSVIDDTLWLLFEECWKEDPALGSDARHVCLALDIIYGTRSKNLQPSLVIKLLHGDWDHVRPLLEPLPHGHSQDSSQPYKCKWLGCSQSFSRIDDCIAHECDEFSKRRIV